ncbi:MAG: zinc-ribbon domain-containing protein [Lachnospiraceae bacterium]|nr:zinc-ribbon domain-containing protein [Lachnospiraceae bacterium]
MFCIHCGAKLEDDAVFCGECGKRVGIAQAGAAGVAAGVATAVAAQAPAQEQVPVRAIPEEPGNIPVETIAPVTGLLNGGIPNAERIIYRIKCPSCGCVQDIGYTGACKQCGTPHNIDTYNNGFLQIYRMGHFSGAAAGEALYLNGEGMGHIANASSCMVELVPGNYNVHMAIGVCRNCEDINVTIEPGKTIYVKSQLKMGMIRNTILLHVVDPSEMPPLA